MGDLLIEGMKRTGKTYGGTTMIRDCWDRGISTASNWEVALPSWVLSLDVRGYQRGEARRAQADARDCGWTGPIHFRYDEPVEIAGVRSTVVFADEAQNSAGARDWESLPKWVRNWYSHLGHYDCVLVLLTQHYKFVDVYLRRLVGKDDVWTSGRLLNLTWWVPRPESDPDQGAVGGFDLVGLRLFIRPWKDLETVEAMGAFWDLLLLSRTTQDFYGTHDLSTAEGRAAETDDKPLERRPVRGPATSRAPSSIARPRLIDSPF
jgi:hypothetical protein